MGAGLEEVGLWLGPRFDTENVRARPRRVRYGRSPAARIFPNADRLVQRRALYSLDKCLVFSDGKRNARSDLADGRDSEASVSPQRHKQSRIRSGLLSGRPVARL